MGCCIFLAAAIREDVMGVVGGCAARNGCAARCQTGRTLTDTFFFLFVIVVASWRATLNHFKWSEPKFKTSSN